jgi:hypothetical protein
MRCPQKLDVLVRDTERVQVELGSGGRQGRQRNYTPGLWRLGRIFHRFIARRWKGTWTLAVDEMEEDEGEECKDAEDQNQHAKDEPGDLPAGAVGGLGDAKGVDESRCKCFKQTHVLRIRRLREWDGTGSSRGRREFESALRDGHLRTSMVFGKSGRIMPASTSSLLRAGPETRLSIDTYVGQRRPTVRRRFEYGYCFRHSEC